MKFIHQLRNALAKDAETIPLEFPRAGRKITHYGSGRLPALAELLEERRDRAAAVLYLTEMIDKSRRQVGATQSLHSTFRERFGQIPDSTFEALPEHTQKALTRIVDMGKPFPASDALLLAHGLSLDGELCRLIASMAGEPEKPQETGAVAARRILQKHHPDKGGDAQTFAAVSEMYKALKQ